MISSTTPSSSSSSTSSINAFAIRPQLLHQATLTFFWAALFLGSAPCDSFSPRLSLRKPNPTTGFALIYGWDDTCDTDNNEKSGSSSNMLSYIDDTASESCTASGVAVAESLSYDPNRVGSLARLAVAFSPPERALTLDQIEHLDILCVESDRIHIQAMICEDGACVSLSVPIKFPQACGDDSWLEGCVMNHLEQLDKSVPPHLLINNINNNADLLDNIEDTNNLPSWWIPPPTLEFQTECRSMRDILNEAEFSLEITALAQESLDHDVLSLHHDDPVQRVLVAQVGPAGLWFRVQTSTILDVLYPFRGGAVTTIRDLRATILGLVATA
jgi:hypothetical protein